MTRPTIIRANVTVFAVLIAFLALIGGLIWDRLAATREARLWTIRTYDVLTTITTLGIAIRDAETGQRGYLLTGNEAYLSPYHAASERVLGLQDELQRLTTDDPAQQERLQALSPVLRHKLGEMARTIVLRRDLGLDAALLVVNDNSGLAMMTQVQSILAAMTQDEQALLTRRLATTDRYSNWLRGFVGFGAAVSVLALAWAAWRLNRATAVAYAAEDQQRTLADRLNTSLHSLSQGVGVFGPLHRLRHWNECFQVLLDLPPALVRAETPYAAFFEHTAAKHMGGNAGPILESEEQVKLGPVQSGVPIIFERRKPNGHYLEIRRTPMPDGGFVLTITDMTKRAQAEAVLRESQKMQAVGQLTGGIAHDFNNLLTVIIGNLELARMKLDPQHPLGLHIERSLWAAQRGGGLTAALLAFARKQPLAPTPIDLSSSMPELVPLLQRTLGEHIDLRFIDSAGLWPAMADPAQLENAVLNLALNARDAMPNGGQLTIELSNAVLDEEYARANAEVIPGDYVMVAVSDTGHGMAPDIAARVFEPFFTTKPEGRGTGLGLAMVFGFVKQTGGHVKVYSELGEGTSVKLYLPRAVGTAVPVAQASGAPAELPRGSGTILLVEDESGVREVTATILRSLGYRVLEAADGEAALLVFGANAAAVDLLLTDVVMPGKVRGRELAERITSMRPEVKVLFMSGYTENAIVHHGRLDEGVQLLGKPFKPEQLAQKVWEALGGAEGEQAASDSDKVVGMRARKRD